MLEVLWDLSKFYLHYLKKRHMNFGVENFREAEHRVAFSLRRTNYSRFAKVYIIACQNCFGMRPRQTPRLWRTFYIA
ncbi:MAG: hypothetical protein CM1200mP29_01040 [Verrucomicrobiota bacterium]|nr:MAG: hypothetical protein CM1200mP29_01040 [Verrucomicrobiota bacterium]